MKKAVIYARVSTDQATQKETPISSQISECFKYAENKGFTVVQVFTDEGISGTTDKRPAFQQMINYVQNNDIKAIITFDTSRLFRNIRHKMNYKELFDKLGVEIHYASNPFLSGNPNNDEERLARFWAEGGAMLFDAWYPIFCSVHIKRGNRENARQGFSTGRPLPIGYKTIKVKYGNTIKSKIIKAEEEAHIYFRILSLFEQGYGSKEIAKRLNEEGITNRGKQWKYQSILKILKNELYIGLVYGGGEKFYHEHLRYISDEKFQEIQEELSKRVKHSRGKMKSNLYFVGILKCGKCGSAMVTETAKGNSYHYYICSKRRKHNGCNQKRLTAKKVDDYLLDVVLNKILNDNVLNQIKKAIEEEINTHIKQIKQEKESIKKAIQTIDMKLNNILKAIENGLIDFDDDEIIQRRKNLKEERKNLESKLKILEHQSNQNWVEIDINLTDFKNLIIDYYKTGNAKQIRKQLEKLINYIEYDNDEFKIYYNLDMFKFAQPFLLVESGGIEPPSENGRCSGFLQA